VHNVRQCLDTRCSYVPARNVRAHRPYRPSRSDLPLFRRSCGLRECVSTGQYELKPANRTCRSTWSTGLAPFWPHGPCAPQPHGASPPPRKCRPTQCDSAVGSLPDVQGRWARCGFRALCLSDRTGRRAPARSGRTPRFPRRRYRGKSSTRAVGRQESSRRFGRRPRAPAARTP
jgi:hypothetical protein